MKYISTRGGLAPQEFCDILLGGLAPDGGLTIPESYPQFSLAKLAELKSMSYADMAFEVISPFITDIPSADLKSLISAAYTAEVFGNGRDPSRSAEITPVTPLADGQFLLELSNGPTLAFKDMAMQLLGHLFEYVLTKRQQNLNILGATSGDTGSAAEYAMRGKKGVRVFMLSPAGKMSAFQRAQMFSLSDENIHNIAITSLFDDCQDLVKAVNKDADFKAEFQLGAVNSINWGRIVAQVAYYFRGYLNAVTEVGEPVDFCVPSGNFGNVCAGHIARQMGLPIRKLVVATNENDVLDEFFRTGNYAPRSADHTFVTSSPSMDISKASNLERFVFDLLGRDATQLAHLWAQVEKGEDFKLDEATRSRMQNEFGFVSGASTHSDRLATIKEVYETTGLEIDTHTADAVKVAQAHAEAGIKMLICETALAAKFEETIQEALGHRPVRPAHLNSIENLPQRSVTMDVDVDLLKDYIRQHC